MKIIENLRIKAKEMKKQLTILYYAYRDERVKVLPKIIIGIAILYALSPIDLIPDFIPILGYIDDLIIIPALIALAIKLIPEDVIKQAKTKVETEPIRLNKNWTFGIFFICIWVFLIFIIAKIVIDMFVK